MQLFKRRPLRSTVPREPRTQHSSWVRAGPRFPASLLALILLVGQICFGQEKSSSLDFGKWLSASASIDGGYRKTQFFLPDYNTGVVQWDSRFDVWLPPFQNKHRGGTYLRLAGIAGTKPNAWQNGWLAEPGFGLQLYPLTWRFLGPLRIFGEYNFTRYWGHDSPNQPSFWRPRNQVRAGFDYWNAINVNAPDQPWWVEVWTGLYWQSTNEFYYRYDSPLFANSVRFGLRKTKSGAISNFTPYLVVQSSRSKFDYAGGFPRCKLTPDRNSRDPANPCDFFWENRLVGGGGLRFAPSLGKLNVENKGWLSRFVFYVEYLDTATYYGPTAPASFPRYDVLVGVSANVGAWYK
jgi:hypothetical protein